MSSIFKSKAKSIDWLLAGVLGAIAAVVYFASCAGYAFPGESAHLMAIWRGLDSPGPVNEYPLMAVFAKMFGASNAFASFLGVLLAVFFYQLVAFFVRRFTSSESFEAASVPASRLAAVVGTVVLIFTPAVREAATHLEPRLFDTVWALMTFLLFIPQFRLRNGLAWCCPLLIGVLAGLGLTDSALFLAMLPLYLFVITFIELQRDRKPYLALFLYVIAGLVTFYSVGPAVLGDFTQALRNLWREFLDLFSGNGSSYVIVFATLPFILTLFASVRALRIRNSWTEWIFHLALSVFSVLAVSTALSPSDQMAPFGVTPVMASVFVAFVAGYLICYWWLIATYPVPREEAAGQKYDKATGGVRSLSLVTCSVMGLAFLFSVMINIFDFDIGRGAFADRVARRVLADLGKRTWFVTDGRLDDHLRLVAAQTGRELNLISLQRDTDKEYIDRLSKLVREKELGGASNGELLRSLSLGVLPFVQDWFSSEPDIASKAATFCAPDLWYSAKIKAVPEFFFFGGDPKAKVDWTASWKEFDGILHADPGWGSYNLSAVHNPVDLLRLSLRRHLGLIANDRGVVLQDEKDDAGAFAMYDLVLGAIDRDNVSALLNELVMVSAGFSVSAEKKQDLNRRFTAIKDEKNRRYIVWALANYYGYVRAPDIFIRLGHSWVRSGRPGDALNQIRRARELIPTDRQDLLLNMMAALYASENDQRKAHEVYQQILAKDGGNHDALIGMMRLALQEGESAKAIGYLERAAKVSGDGKVADTELALLAMMKGDYKCAGEYLRKVIDREADNMQAWSLYASLLMQQADVSKDQKEQKNLMHELSHAVLPKMEKLAKSPNDYYLLMTRAFLLMRQGAEGRRAARDAFVAASRERRDISSTQDLVLGLDISLNDVEEAEKHAREVLRRNRRAPLANYVLGSIALRNGNYTDAEAYLRLGADAPRPVVLAMNDLSEVLRRQKKFAEAERYARLAVKTAPNLYVAWETLGSILMDRDRKGADRQRDLAEAEQAIRKACDLSHSENGRADDVRMLISLARVQFEKGDRKEGLMTLSKVRRREKELSEFEKGELKELMKRVNK